MSYVTVIGAATVDISGKSFASIKPRDSNPGSISRSAGGVGRNIAENLARLGVDVKLIAALGGDMFGREVLNQAKAVGIDMDHCYIDEKASTSIYVAVLDANGEMHVAVMESACHLTKDHIQKQADLIKKSKIILLDANLEEEINASILDAFPGKDMYIDPISITKSKKIQHIVGRFHTIKMNQLEAAALTGIEIKDEESLKRAGEYFMNRGTQRVIISLGEGGIYYRSPTEEIRRRAHPLTPKSATGAGDALMAAVVYCSLMEKSAHYAVEFAQAMARLTLMSEKTVSDKISAAEIERQMKGL